MKYSLVELLLFVREIEEKVTAQTPYKLNILGTDGNKFINYEFVQLRQLKEFIKSTLNSDYTDSPQTIYINETENQQDSFFAGYFQLKFDKNKHIIILNSTKNYCWKRFSLIKELCQIYLDHHAVSGDGVKVKDVTTDYMQCVDDAFKVPLQFESNDYLLGENYDNETSALLMALELMIPFKHREQNTLKIYTELLLNEKIKMIDIATSLRIPEFILKRYFDSKLINLSTKLRKELN